MKLKIFISICIAKIASFFIKTLNLGTASTWPGEIALKLNKNIISDLFKINRNLKIILIAGTNGKTTTAKLIKHILESANYKVFSNEEGANLENGIASSLIKTAKSSGIIKYDVAIFETDENALPKILKTIKPYAIILLNLFRDQLDRYGEVNSISKRWNRAILSRKDAFFLFINGQDPELLHLGNLVKNNVYFFGIGKKYLKKNATKHEADSIYCPKCKNRLTFTKFAYSHLGEFKCAKCGFGKNKINNFEKIKLTNFPLLGIHNIYNLNSALLATKIAFKIPVEKSLSSLNNFSPAFGRGEELNLNGKKIIILLSKNPAGFNRSIELSSKENNNNIMLLLNDRAPDGKDISWIWDFDIEKHLDGFNKVFIGGDRLYDMALRLKYASNNNQNYKSFEMNENLRDLIKSAVSKTRRDQILYILPTYTAMLEVRKILVGKKI